MNTNETLKKKMSKFIEDFFILKVEELKSLKNQNTSHRIGIGGNIFSSSSGDIVFEKQYYEHGGYYGLSRVWDGVLKIGTNIKIIEGKTCLVLAEMICEQLKEKLTTDFYGCKENIILDENGKSFGYFNYEYHSNYCTVKYIFY